MDTTQQGRWGGVGCGDGQSLIDTESLCPAPHMLSVHHGGMAELTVMATPGSRETAAIKRLILRECGEVFRELFMGMML